MAEQADQESRWTQQTRRSGYMEARSAVRASYPETVVREGHVRVAPSQPRHTLTCTSLLLLPHESTNPSCSCYIRPLTAIYCVCFCCFYCTALKKFNLPALVRLFSFLPKLPSWRIEPGTSVYETIVLPAELMINLCNTI